MMDIKIGTAPISWGVMEVEGWGGQEPYSKVLDEIADAGYEGTELGPYGYLPTEPERLKTELSSRGLLLVSAFVPIPLAKPEGHQPGFQEALRVAQLLSEAGSKLIVLADEMSKERMAVAGRVVEERDGMSERDWDRATKLITRVAEACRELGIATAFHHHTGTFVETPSEIDRLCRTTEASLVGLCLDTGHYLYGGGDPLEAVKKYGSRIWHLHLKDIRQAVMNCVRENGIGFLDAVRSGIFCELGEGAVDFPGVIHELKACGYGDWAVWEQDTDTGLPGIQPFQSAIHSRRYLKSVLGR